MSSQDATEPLDSNRQSNASRDQLRGPNSESGNRRSSVDSRSGNGRPEFSFIADSGIRDYSRRSELEAQKEESLKSRRQYDLDPTQPLVVRVSAVNSICSDIHLYSYKTLVTLWNLMADLGAEKAPLEARTAVYGLLTAIASHPAAHSTEDRENFFHSTITPIQPSEASLQVSALESLTRYGKRLSPFEADLIVFLNTSLEALFLATERARELQAGENSAEQRLTRDALSITGAGRLCEGSSTKNRTLEKKANHSVHGEEKGLLGTFYLVEAIIDHNPDAFHDAQLEILVERMVSIANLTTSRKDLRGVVKILRAITNRTRIPPPNITPCVNVLCAIFGVHSIRFEDEVWSCFDNLLQSKDQAATRDSIIEVLISADFKAATKVRGALRVIQRLTEHNDSEGLLISVIAQLSIGLRRAKTLDTKLEPDILRTINVLLSRHEIVRSIAAMDWDIITEVVDELEMTKGAMSMSHPRIDSKSVGKFVTDSSPLFQLISKHEKYGCLLDDSIIAELECMSNRIALFLSRATAGRQKSTVILRILVHIALHVPSTWESTASIMWDQGILLPSDENWEAHTDLLIHHILCDPRSSNRSRCLVLQILGQVYAKLDNTKNQTLAYEDCLRRMCQRLYNERDLPRSVISSLASLTDLCGPDLEFETFEALLGLIQEKSKISSLNPVVSEKLDTSVTDSLIKLFLRCLPKTSSKTTSVYNLLLLIAGPLKPVKARLSVFKLLIRLRCDSNGAVVIEPLPDRLGLAGALLRAEASATSSRFSQSPPNHALPSEHSQLSATPPSRSSTVSTTKSPRSCSLARSVADIKDRKANSPLWMYDGTSKGLPENPPVGPSPFVFSGSKADDKPSVLNLSPWLDILIEALTDNSEWEVYSYIIVHLPSQLSNRSLFAHHVRQLQTIHNLLVDQLDKSSFPSPPRETELKSGDVALCLYHTLISLVAYHEHLGRRELDNMVRTFTAGINKWDKAGKCCIHALALCCYEMPSVIDRHIFVITQRMSQKITQSDLAIDILEFLSGLSRLPDACVSATAKLPDSRSNADLDDGTFLRTIFGMCAKYIQSARDDRQKPAEYSQMLSPQDLNRQSGISGTLSGSLGPSKEPTNRKDLQAYVYALAYHVITCWFLSTAVNQRAQHVGWIAKELAWKNKTGEEVLEEQSQVILDMMHRTAYSDLGETEPDSRFDGSNDTPIKKTWLVGMSITTVEILPIQSIGQFTKRQASGTTHALYYHNTAALPKHHARNQNDSVPIDLYPNHMFLQIASTIAPVPIPLQPVILPDEDFVKRAIRSFDMIDTVDGHKIGIVYIDKNQTLETEILANTAGSSAYEDFLLGLGTSVKLQGAKFNTQGLDREANIDGTHTYAWRDRVTEIVFHVTTMMPTNLEYDPQGNNKKRHIGNDRVKIIFNNSGKDFEFDTFPSEFNDVNIVITPDAHTGGNNRSAEKAAVEEPGLAGEAEDLASNEFGYYTVHTLCSSRFPQLSAAAIPKVISASALSGFVRQLALSASVFSQVWSESLGEGEYVSSWRARLQAIKRLREKYGNTHTSANISYPMPSDASTPAYVEGDGWNGRVAMGGMAEPEQLLRGLDFTRWT